MSVGLGGALIGLQVGGPWGAAIGFTLAIVGMIVIDWAMGGDIGKAGQRGFADIISKRFGGPSLAIPGIADVLFGNLGGGIPSSLRQEPGSFIQGGVGQSRPITINNVTNITGAGTEEIKRQIDVNNITQTEDIRRLIKT